MQCRFNKSTMVRRYSTVNKLSGPVHIYLKRPAQLLRDWHYKSLLTNLNLLTRLMNVLQFFFAVISFTSSHVKETCLILHLISAPKSLVSGLQGENKIK